MARSPIQTSALPEGRDLRVFALDPASIPIGFHPHRHDYYELLWFGGDGGANIVDFQEHPIYGRRVFFMSPGQVHELAGAKQPGTLITFSRSLLVGPGTLDLESAWFEAFEDVPFRDLNSSVMETLTRVVDLLRAESERPTASWAILQSLLAAFVLIAIRGETPAKAKGDGGPDERLATLRYAIEQNYILQRDANFYAQRLGLTAKRVNEITRAALGKTVTQLLHERLVLQAKRDLHFSSRSAKEIAHSLGFDDPGYFSRFFKKHVGLTAREFRNARSSGSTNA